jgi:hypothetical protein
MNRAKKIINLVEDLWPASKPGFSPGVSATTQLIPEQGKSRYIATNKGMMKGYWKVLDTQTNQAVQSGIRSKEVAQEQADKWNKGIYAKRNESLSEDEWTKQAQEKARWAIEYGKTKEYTSIVQDGIAVLNMIKDGLDQSDILRSNAYATVTKVWGK